MQVGDLVKYVSPSGRWDNDWNEVGIVIKCIPGIANYTLVRWSKSEPSTLPARNLEVISERR
jgi:hypothetical protein